MEDPAEAFRQIEIEDPASPFQETNARMEEAINVRQELLTRYFSSSGAWGLRGLRDALLLK